MLKYGFCKSTSIQYSADLEKNGGQKCSTGRRFIFTEITFYKIHISIISGKIQKMFIIKTPCVRIHSKLNRNSSKPTVCSQRCNSLRTWWSRLNSTWCSSWCRSHGNYILAFQTGATHFTFFSTRNVDIGAHCTLAVN